MSNPGNVCHERTQGLVITTERDEYFEGHSSQATTAIKGRNLEAISVEHIYPGERFR
ncbi:MAG: hypothetical protein JNL58_00620 [Planctomyces sp.]|nr:hypothetical protein [Planctomyces sp.]